MTTPTPARDAAFPDQSPDQSRDRSPDDSPQERPARAAARGHRFTARRTRGARRRSAPAVPPVERASGWLVALAVLVAAVLFSVLAMNAFMGG